LKVQASRWFVERAADYDGTAVTKRCSEHAECSLVLERGVDGGGAQRQQWRKKQG
jgi:hypothetical protein